MTMREIIPSGRRERRVNLGNSAVVSGANRVALLNWQSDDDAPMILTIICERLSIPSDELGEADFRPYAHVKWGHGGIDMEGDFEITARTRIAFSASTITVQVYVNALPLAAAAGSFNVLPQTPDDVAASFRGWIALGNENDAPLPTRFQNQFGVGYGVLVGPKGVSQCIIGQQLRLSNFRAFATGTAGGAYLQLFDQPTTPANGDVPIVSVPINIEPIGTASTDAGVDIEYARTRGFTQGLGWAISTTPFALTIATAEAFVTAEFELPFPTI